MTPRELANNCVAESNPKLDDLVTVICSSCNKTSIKQFKYVVKCCRNSCMLYLCRTCSNRRIATDPVIRDKMVKTIRAQSKCSDNTKKLWQNDEYRRKITEASKIVGNRPDEKLRRSTRAVELWNNDAYRLAVTSSCVENYRQPDFTAEVREKLRQSTTRNWAIREIADRYRVGLDKCRAWSSTDDNKAVMKAINDFNRTEAGRRILAERALKQLTNGEIVTYGERTKLQTTKGGEFTTRSSFETRYVHKLEEDDNIIRFIYEPFYIEYEFDDLMHNYTPDFLIIYSNFELELVEVKPKKLINTPKNAAKIMAGRQTGIRFVIVTEDDL